jgi:Na+/H+-translocating membrane pyrophosphatase
LRFFPSLACAVSVTGIVFACLMLIIVYRTTKSQEKIRKISPVILLSAEEYLCENRFSASSNELTVQQDKSYSR